jgi:hypothetical protein
MWQMTRRLISLMTALAAAGALQAAEDAGRAAGPGANEVYFGTFYKPVCDKVVAGFEAETSASWPEWERRNHAGVAALESNPQFEASRREALVAPPPELAAAKSQELSVTCERVANLYEAALPSDVRFDAPARTWETFRQALREGNRALIRRCLIGDARRTLTPPLQAMTDEQLRRMADAVAELKLTEATGSYQEAIVVQKDGNVGRIAFVRNGANWKIAQM